MSIKNFITVLTLCLSSLPVFAGKEQMSVYCSDTDSILGVITEKYSEKPMMRLRGDDNKYVIYHNSSTGTWTMVQLNVTQSMSCVIATGTGIDLPRTSKSQTGSV